MSDQNKAAAQSEVGEGISLPEILQVIVDNLRVLVIGPILIGLIVLGISFFLRPTYTAVTVFLPPQQQQSAAAAMMQTLGALGGVAGAVSGIRNPVDQYVALAGSRSVRDAIIERFDLKKYYDEELSDDARKKLKEKTRINAGKDGLIRLEVDDRDPRLASEIANAYVQELSKLMGRLALSEAQQRRSLFESHLQRAKEGLFKAEVELKKSGVGEAALKASPGSAVSSVASLMAQVAAKEVQLSVMRNYLAETSPDFLRVQSELAALRSQLSKSEKESSSSNESDYVAKFRNYKYFETLFELMAKQYEIARIDESREGAVIQIVDSAVVPERKSRPRHLPIFGMTVLLTFAFFLVMVFLRRSEWMVGAESEGIQKLRKIIDSLLHFGIRS